MLETHQKAHAVANKVMPEIAKNELDGEHRYFEVTVREEGQQTIYRAVPTFHGEWLA